MHYHLFGAATPTGEAFRQLAIAHEHCSKLFAYSRHPQAHNVQVYHADFDDPDSFWPGMDSAEPSLWISFAPIWLLVPFFENLLHRYPERLGDLRGLIACSSSSVLTKRFAFNHYDRDLVARLNGAEAKLIEACRQLKIPCRILRPTIIYGKIGPFGDRNLSRLVNLMRRLPVLPVPDQSGLRQPIHCIQLAAIAHRLAQKLADGSSYNTPIDAINQAELVTLGGDQELTYADMLRALQDAQPQGDSARRCLILPIPNRLLFFAALPLLLCSPKSFEAVLRLGADLAGFMPCHDLLDVAPQSFPLETLS